MFRSTTKKGSFPVPNGVTNGFPQPHQMKIAIGYNVLIALAFSIPVFLLRMEFPVTQYGVQSRETSPKKCFYYKPPFNRFEDIFYGNLHDSVSRFVFIQPNWRLKRIVLIFYDCLSSHQYPPLIRHSFSIYKNRKNRIRSNFSTYMMSHITKLFF